jgi:hypothetical protein
VTNGAVGNFSDEKIYRVELHWGEYMNGARLAQKPQKEVHPLFDPAEIKVLGH